MTLRYLVTACCLAAVAPLAGQQATPSMREVAGTVVAIPFNPPLNEPLLYRLTVDETRDGRPVSTRLDLRVTFTRDAVSHIMTTAYLLPPRMPPTHPAIAMLMRPVALRLNDRGEITGMVDEAGYWAAIDTIVDGLARHAGDGDPSAAPFFRSFIASMRSMSEESRLALIARNFSPLIEYSGAEMRLNEVLEGSVAGESALGPVVQDVRTILTHASASEAQVQTSYRLAPGQLEATMRNLQARFGRVPDSRSMQAFDEINIERRDTFRISLSTGLTEWHETIITANGQIEGQPGRTRKTQRLVRVPQPAR